MKKKKPSRSRKILVSLFFCTSLFAKTPHTSYRTTYIEKFKGIAMQEMKRSGIPASITLAQGILESGWGKSPLARATNNHFGIKCHASWEGERYVTNSETANEDVSHACYRAYNNPKQSFRDHTNFIVGQSLYKSLFAHKDYHDWAEGLEACGYAGSRNYSEQLVNIIDKNQLFQFDIEVEVEEAKQSLALYQPNQMLDLVYNSLSKNEFSVQKMCVVSCEILTEDTIFFMKNNLEIVAPALENRRRNTKKGEGLENLWS